MSLWNLSINDFFIRTVKSNAKMQGQKKIA